MEIVQYSLATAGFLVFIARLKPWIRDDRLMVSSNPKEIINSVSIVIPCRNEEKNIGTLLDSLFSLVGVAPEIIVVDDGSSDRTGEIARGFTGIQVITAPPKPPGWVGKSWACWIGAAASQGQYLLFTDADTVHDPDSLVVALGKMIEDEADLLSAMPYHRAELKFEKFLGLFYLLPLVATAVYRPSKLDRFYAIGQYLLFKRTSYFALEGHSSVRSSLVEDMALAERIMKDGYRYQTLAHLRLYTVQMYADWLSLLIGWIRLLRLGMSRTSKLAFIETFLVLYAFAQINWLFPIGAVAVCAVQKRFGKFSIWGAILSPLNVIFFIALSFCGIVMTVLRKPIIWRGRIYDYS